MSAYVFIPNSGQTRFTIPVQQKPAEQAIPAFSTGFLNCQQVEKEKPGENFEMDLNPKKVGSKRERRERVYKRTAKEQRDFLRKRRSKADFAPT